MTFYELILLASIPIISYIIVAITSIDWQTSESTLFVETPQSRAHTKFMIEQWQKPSLSEGDY